MSPGAQCPLCGRANDCGAARGDCWCFTTTFLPGMVERAKTTDSCLCADCARGEVASPCVKICRLDPRSGECLGCGRTSEEIAGWPSFDIDRRLAVWRRLRAR